MKPRARRVTLAAAVLGVGVIAILVVAKWNTVRDHVEAWWFQATHQTAELSPGQQATKPGAPSEVALQVLANQSGLPVLYDPEAAPVMLGDGFVPSTHLLKLLDQLGYCLTEQRFPRRAWVVVGYPER